MNKIVTQHMTEYTVKAFVEGNDSVFEVGDNESVAISKLLLRLQGYPSRTWNGAYILACFSWASLFTESWLLLTGNLENDGLTWFMWGFFFIVAVISVSYGSRT